MQDLKPDVFLHTMQSAALYNMPKLLACCEYHVATIFMKTRDTALVVQCMTDQLLLQSLHSPPLGRCLGLQKLARSSLQQAAEM